MMIRIPRHDESRCPELADIRESELERVRAALKRGERVTNELLGQKYDVARVPLFEIQHHKCCYCDSKQNSHRWNTTEHFRPKAVTTREGVEHPGYWWLTWTWANLLFCCTQCNAYKHTHFSLAQGSTPLYAEQQPPGLERPMLLDPGDRGDDDPRQHIQFLPVGDNWWPFPRGGSARGKEFLTRLKLYHPELGNRRPGLVSKWRAHARRLQPEVARVREALATRDRHTVQTTWTTHVTPHLFCTQEFVALSIDVFDRSFGAEQRSRYELPLDPIPLPT